MKRTNGQKGITLVALIITIIILLILAVVAISAVTGDGIVNHAKNARTEYGKAQDEEQTALNNYISKIEENLPGGNTGGAFAQIDANNYGASIEYSVDLNNDGNKTNDWKVFYKDENNLYIIASDYLNNSLLPTGLNMDTYSSYPYSAYWLSDFTSYGSRSITEEVANKYMLSWWANNKTSTEKNARATGDLLNTSAWTASFGDASKGIEAIGGPTLEMWIASWNAKGEKLGTSKYVSLKTEYNGTGYFVGPTTVESLSGMESKYDETVGGYRYCVGTSTDGYKDTLYFPHTKDYGRAFGYWLASPSAEGLDAVYHVFYNGDIGAGYAGDDFNDQTHTVRPLVSVPSNLVTSDAEGNLKVAQ